MRKGIFVNTGWEHRQNQYCKCYPIVGPQKIADCADAGLKCINRMCSTLNILCEFAPMRTGTLQTRRHRNALSPATAADANMAWKSNDRMAEDLESPPPPLGMNRVQTPMLRAPRCVLSVPVQLAGWARSTEAHTVREQAESTGYRSEAYLHYFMTK
eukprot:6061040-Pleurochrysis_carterae.AAC.1